MATGDTDSEENVTKYCTSCELEDQHVVAFGYCIMCVEYLCNQCYESHLKPLVTRNHVLLKENEIPIKDIAKKNKHVDVLCRFHKKPIDYFCQKCDNVGCYNCISIHHKICDNVTLIPQYVESRHISWSSFMDVCDDTIKNTKNLVTLCQRFNYEVERNTKQVKQQVKDFHDEMTNALDECDLSVNRKIEEISLDDKTKLDTLKETCKSYEDLLKIYINESKIANGHELFVYNALAVEFQREIQNSKDQIKIRQLHFKANWPVTSGKCGGFGQLLDVSTVPTQVTMKQDVVLNANSRSFHSIRECIILQNGYLMFTYTTGTTLNVCYSEGSKSEGQKFISVWKFDDPPWGLVELDEGPKVAVTVPTSQKVVFLMISCCNENNTEPVQMLVDGEFATNGECKSIAWLGKEFVVSFGDPAKVEIISPNGDVLKTVRDMKDEAWGFQDPISVACDVKQQLIYVADYKNNTVVLADPNGNVKTVFENMFDSPMSLAVDKDGAVLVAVKWPYSLQMISSHFFDNKTLLDINQVRGIQCIAYAASDHSVYVASSNNGPSITKWKFVSYSQSCIKRPSKGKKKSGRLH